MSKMGMNDIFKQAQKMQENMQRIQDEVAKQEVEGSAGGGMVNVTVNGKQEVIGVRIDTQVIDPDESEMLEDLIVAAVNQALQKSQELMSQEMSKAAGGMLPPGFKLPGM